MQCPKYLYLNKYKPKERTPHDAETLQKFKEGKDFESIFKDRFAPAVDVAAVLAKDVYTMGASYTSALLERSEACTLFEACFLHEKTLVMTDVLLKNADGSYVIYEIKNSDQVKEVFLWDLSLQYYICTAVLQAPLRFHIVLNDGEDGYHIIDLTEELEAHVTEMSEKVSAFLGILKQDQEPDIPMGPQCAYPYPCMFREYCTRTGGKNVYNE